ncbi:MAG: DNA repair protein RecO [Ruminococcus sp.]|jgi:DNA repair protein RecO (recombination protein O)|nr:DNA repair protein RecO [Ruminococcus sp.]
MKFITNGLIIREQNIGEKDKLVTALTESRGVVKGFAHGAKDIKSPKRASTTLLSYSRLTLHKSRDSYIIGDAKSLRIFSGLRESIEKMYLAQYFCELAQAICPKEQDASDQLKLILNGLYLLSENKRPPMLIKPCVELRLMCLAGYMPDIMMCKECGKYEDDAMFFLPKSGQLICRECYEKLEAGEHRITLNKSTLTALRHCCYVEPERLFSFTIPENDLRTLNFCSEEYIKFILERSFKTLDFLKTLE